MTQTLSRAEIEEWRQEFRTDPIMNPEALAELETLCTMALSHADAYERGQRDMAAAAVKVAEEDRCC